mmetsp:Transcript_70951/g.207925  ORF Transcript_70951/g.207925 Transcript_70951/m.207925 type:complete len:318 (-) Transcript_70951:907-1860(-)
MYTPNRWLTSSPPKTIGSQEQRTPLPTNWALQLPSSLAKSVSKLPSRMSAPNSETGRKTNCVSAAKSLACLRLRISAGANSVDMPSDQTTQSLARSWDSTRMALSCRSSLPCSSQDTSRLIILNTSNSSSRTMAWEPWRFPSTASSLSPVASRCQGSAMCARYREVSRPSSRKELSAAKRTAVARPVAGQRVDPAFSARCSKVALNLSGGLKGTHASTSTSSSNHTAATSAGCKALTRPWTRTGICRANGPWRSAASKIKQSRTEGARSSAPVWQPSWRVLLNSCQSTNIAHMLSSPAWVNDEHTTLRVGFGPWGRK